MMKTVLKIMVGVLSLGFLASCTTLSPVPYTFVEADQESASLTVERGNPGLELLYVEDAPLPPAEEGTYWNPVTVPAGREFLVRVHAEYRQQSNTSSGGLLGAILVSAIDASRGVDTEVEFVCPALEPGKGYTLKFTKGAGLTGANQIILVDDSTEKIVFKHDFK